MTGAQRMWCRRLAWLIPSSLILIVVAVWVSDRVVREQTLREMNQFALETRQRAKIIDDQLDSVLQTLNSLGGRYDHCSEPVLKEMAQEVRSSSYSYDAALRMPDGTICSSYGHLLPASALPQYSTDTHYPRADHNYWFSGTATTDQNHPLSTFLVIAKGPAYIWVNKAIFFNALQTDTAMTYQLIDASSLETVLAKEALHPAITESPKIGQLIYDHGYWHLTFVSQWANLLGVVSLPHAVYQRAWWMTFLAVLLGGALLCRLLFRLGVYTHRRRFSLAALLARALRRNQLTLQYQPIVDLQSGHWCGAEALVRWQRKGEYINPTLFVAEAQRSGMSCVLTRWVCRRVALDYALYFQHVAGLYITINLSAEDLADREFPEFIHTLFTQYKIPADLIVFELTESILVDKTMAAFQLARLKDLGHRIAIDDFGTGYSSLAYLEHLPIDILKIDRSFLTLDRCYAPDAMWRQVVGIAHARQYTVVAEGVEYAEQAELLQREGVTLIQGWLYSKALPPAQLVRGKSEPHSIHPLPTLGLIGDH